MERRDEQLRLVEALSAAGDAVEIDLLLAANRELVTSSLVEDALVEVREHIRGTSPLPRAFRLPLARHILDVNLRVAGFLRDRVLIARCLQERGSVRLMSGEPAPAADDLRAALTRWRDLGNLVEAGRCAGLVGDALVAVGQPQAALTELRHAATLLDGVDDDAARALLGIIHQDIGAILFKRGEQAEALAEWTQAVHYRVVAGHVEQAVTLLNVLLPARLEAGDHERAYPHAQRLVELLDTAPDCPAFDPEVPELLWRTAAARYIDSMSEGRFLLDHFGDAQEAGSYTLYVDTAALDDARRWCALAERVLAILLSEEGSAVVAMVGAQVAVHGNDPDLVLELVRTALPYFERNDLRPQITSLLMAATMAERQRGNLPACVEWCRRGLELNTPNGRSTWLIVLGETYHALGRSAEAIDVLRDAIAATDSAPDSIHQVDVGAAYFALGAAFAYLGQLEPALDAYAAAWDVARSVGHRRGRAAIMHGIAIALAQTREGRFGAPSSPVITELVGRLPPEMLGAGAGPATAEDGVGPLVAHLLNRAGGIYREISYEVGVTQVLSNLSNLVPRDQAIHRVQMLREVVNRYTESGDRFGLAVNLANLGSALWALGEVEEAADAYGRSLKISRPAGYFESAAQASFELGQLREQSGDLDAARGHYSDAVAMTEAARADLPLVEAHRVGFVRGKTGAYQRLIDLLVDDQRYGDAFALVQRAKSRALLELVGTTPVKPSVPRTGRMAGLLTAEQECLDRLRAAQHGPDLRAGHGVNSTALAQLTEIYDEMEQIDAEYVAMRRGAPISVDSLRGWLRAQDRPILLVEYFLSDRRLTIFLLRAEWDEVEVHVAGLTPEQVWAGFRDFHRDVVQHRNAGGAGWTARMRPLVEPILRYLRSEDMLYLIPHRMLHGLPLHALPLAPGPLAQSHPVAYVPMAGLLPLVQNAAGRTGRLDTCASFGVVFDAEAYAVAEVFDASAVTRVDLTPDEVLAHCTDKDVCHFSCHGHFDAVAPLSSGLILRTGDGITRDPAGVLTARAVMESRLNTELVCLSACQTAMSEIGEGDELIGLVRAFLHAGAPTVVASLWSVDAAATRELMVTFYRYLHDRYRECGTIDKVTALQRSQQDMMARAGIRSSFLWAPFVLIGDWR